MAKLDTTDLTFRTDYSGNVVFSKDAEHVMNVINMLFNSIPGLDDYNNDMGLYLNKIRVRPHDGNQRDNELELDINKMITTYTDFLPLSVIVMYPNNQLKIFLQLEYLGKIYELNIIETDNTLISQLVNQS